MENTSFHVEMASVLIYAAVVMDLMNAEIIVMNGGVVSARYNARLAN